MAQPNRTGLTVLTAWAAVATPFFAFGLWLHAEARGAAIWG